MGLPNEDTHGGRSWNTEKNRHPDNKLKWNTEDLYFDKDGRLIVRNPDLADEIASVMNAWSRRLVIIRDTGDAPGGGVPMEPRRAMGGASAYRSGPASGSEETVVSEVKNPVNMMCPCLDEGTP